MRHLRPGRLIELSSGLWALDASQPVAAVLDPDTGAIRRIVSWVQVPPAPAGDEQWPPPAAIGDGSSLWVQQEPSGPLVRVDVDGVQEAVWTDGLHLTACGPGEAWCAPTPPGQELVDGAGAGPVRELHTDRLLRVTPGRRCETVEVEHPVRHLQAEPDALLMEVDVEPWQRHSLGVGMSGAEAAESLGEIVWPTRWLRLPWGSDLPRTLSLDSHGVDPREEPARQFDDDAADVDARALLPGGPVDITEHCRPLVPRPLEAGSYAQRTLAANSSIGAYWQAEDGTRSPLTDGMSDTHTSLQGEWPDTCLEWTFALDRYPGLRLRRRVPLFDELGRIVPPELATIQLMEDIDTCALPPASQARDGILDI